MENFEVLIYDAAGVPHAYPVLGEQGFRQQLITQFPPKLVVGDVNKDDEQYLSSFIQNDVLSGVGLFRILDKSQTERAWFSWLNTAYRSGVTLPPYVYNFGSPSVQTVAITAATNASPIVLTTAANAYITGQVILIQGVTGNTAANGSWTITVVDGTHFSLNNSIGNANYIAGGTASLLETGNVTCGCTFNGHTYVAYGLNVYQLNDAPVDGGTGVTNFTLRVSFSHAVTAMVVFNGLLWVISGDAGDEPQTSVDGTVWNDDEATGSAGGAFLLVHSNKLWRFVHNTLGGGTVFQLTTAMADWTVAPGVLSSQFKATNMVDYIDSLGDPAIFLSTTGGEYVLDESITPPIWELTQLSIPIQATNGMGTINWRGDLYVDSALDTYKYTAGNPATIDVTTGLSADEGVPFAPVNMNGVIQSSCAALNDRYVYVNQGAAQSTTLAANAFVVARMSSMTNAIVFNTFPTNGVWVGAYNGQGWRVIWQSPGGQGSGVSPGGNYSLFTSSISSTLNRIYWGWNAALYSADLLVGIRNPWQNTLSKYQAGPLQHWTPNFQGLAESLIKVATSLQFMCQNMSSTETITPWYALDYSMGWQPFLDSSGAQIILNTNGLHELFVGPYQGPAGYVAPVGTSFNAIQYRFDFARGSDNTKSPVLMYWLMKYLKIFPIRWGFTITLPLTDTYKGRGPAQMVGDLMDILETSPMVIMQFRDPSSGSQMTPAFAVKVTHLQATEMTGLDYRGTWQLSLMAPAGP